MNGSYRNYPHCQHFDFSGLETIIHNFHSTYDYDYEFN